MAQDIQAGSLLKATREAKGISLETVHEATKIPMDALKAIEEGYSVRTISSFYLKGFMKMYAEYLNVNVKEISPEPDLKKKQPPRLSASPEQEFDLEQWISKTFTRERKQQIAIGVGVLLCFFILFKIITFFTHRAPAPAKVKKVKVDAKAVKVKAVDTKTTKTKDVKAEKDDVIALENIRIAEIVKAEKPSLQVSQRSDVVKEVPTRTASAAPQSSATPQEAQTKITLTARAKKDSWLRVKSDGAVVFQSTLSRGAVETWLAHDRIEISGKNINQLEFELNGKLIGTLARRDYDAKKVIVTKDGLSVGK